jgi:hypothetical protein
MAPTYGLAEQAADIIRHQYNYPTSTTSGPQAQSTTSKSGASRVQLPSLTYFMIVIGLVLLRAL